MKKLCWLLWLLGALPLAAQQQPINGTVRDDTGQPVAGASIRVRGTAQGTTTGPAGQFQLTAPPTGTLEVSSVGFAPQAVEIGGRPTLDISLKRSETSLDEVVVLGYSTATQRNLTGSAQAITPKALKDVTANTVSQMLQGKAAGVYVGTASGDPRATPRIVIRGIGTLTASSEPLYVVDGVIGGIPNPSDIESLTVLKDAAATALYGARASNGVIVVTTRRGRSGKTALTLRYNQGVGSLNLGNFRLMDGPGLYALQKAVFQRDRPGQDVSTYLPTPENNANTNWFGEAFQLARNTLLEASASGGSEKTRFYLSGNYYNEQGILKGTGLSRYGLRLNFSNDATDRLRLTLNTAATYTRGHDNSNNALYGAYTYLPYDSPYLGSSLYNPVTGAKRWYGRDNANFLYNQQFNTFRENRLVGDVLGGLEYRLLPGLRFTSTNRLQGSFYDAETNQDRRGNAALDVGGRLAQSTSRDYTLLTSNLLRYSHDLGGGQSVSGFAGYEYQTYYFQSTEATGRGIYSGLSILNATSQPEAIAGSKNDNAFQSYLFQANYDYRSKYLLTASFRRDGSSKFGRDRRYGNFYAVGLTWLASEEAFLKNAAAIDNLKFRLSYGTTGNADGISDYASQGLYSLAGQYAGLVAANPIRIENPNLSWEISNNANAGVDVVLWKRLNFTADFYHRLTNNLLFNRPLQGTSGYAFITENIGAVRNAGVELLLSADVARGGAFRLTAEFNASFNRNQVTALYADRTLVANGNRPFALGRPLNSWYMRRWLGVDPQTGNPTWQKINADGTTTATSNYNDATLQFIGSNANPKVFGGIRQVLGFGGFEFSAFFAYSLGATLYNTDRAYFDNDGAYDRYNLMALAPGWTRWEKPGDNATHPRYVIGGNNNSQRTSSRYLESGNYLRLRNVMLSYEVPAARLARLGLGSLRLTASADNVLTLTRFSGVDPDVNVTGEVGTKYPFSRKLVAGVQLTF